MPDTFAQGQNVVSDGEASKTIKAMIAKHATAPLLMRTEKTDIYLLSKTTLASSSRLSLLLASLPNPAPHIHFDSRHDMEKDPEMEFPVDLSSLCRLGPKPGQAPSASIHLN